MIARLRRAIFKLSYLPRTLQMIWQAAPRLTIIWAALLVVQGAIPVATIYTTSRVIDGLAGMFGRSVDWQAAQPVLVQVGLVAALTLAGLVLERIIALVDTAQSELISDYIQRHIHTQSVAVDMAFYETPEYHDQLHRARSGAGERSLALLQNIGSLLRDGVMMTTMVVALIPFGIFMPLLLVLGSAPMLGVLLYMNRRFHQWWETTTPLRRRTEYHDMMLTSSVAAAELRLFDLGSHFRTAYQSLRVGLRRERLRLARDQAIAQLVATMLSLLVGGAAVVSVVWRAIQGQVSLGELVLFYQVFNNSLGVLHELLRNIGQILNNTLYLSHLFAFLDIEPAITDPPTPRSVPAVLAQGIQFRDVTFAYPNNDRLALRSFDLHIPAGKTIAIVGANGAGKSTLIKLLCRFYDPQAGSIQLDGVDLRDMPVSQLRRMISVLFQQPVNYQATVAENIAVGDLHGAGQQPAQIERAACLAGAHDVIARLPQGYETLLGKAFVHGTDLSGGEWQRVALARAFLRQSPIVLLDEPTSFMDSWAEAEWLDRFADLVAGRTAIIITHRFTTAMRADIIYVMDQGQIVETGTHAELLAGGGMYASSWHAQMQASRGEAFASTAREGRADACACFAPTCPVV